MKRLGADCMYLDISHKPVGFIIKHFPTIHERCLAVGIDITKEAMPIVPAAHYTCGGVMIDNNGQTDIPGLYAIGEVTYTGLHGANRMASCSNAWSMPIRRGRHPGQATDERGAAPSAGVGRKQGGRFGRTGGDPAQLARAAADDVGLCGDSAYQQTPGRAKRRIDLLKQEVQEYYAHFRVSNNLLELRNLLQVAELIVNCALQRKESRGLHYNLDYPDMQPDSKPTVLTPERD